MRKHGWQGALLTKGHSLDDFTYVKCPGQGATEAECRLVVARTGVGAGGGGGRSTAGRMGERRGDRMLWNKW